MDPSQPRQPIQLPDYMQEPSSVPVPKRSRSRMKVILGALLIIVIVFAGSAGFVLWQTSTIKNFQAYAPSKLPQGITISKHSTSNIAVNNDSYKLVEIDTNTNDFLIGEEKSNQAMYDLTAFSCSLTYQDSVCKTYKSPAGQSYDVRTNYDSKSNPLTQSVAWLKDSTRFWISLQNKQVSNYSDSSWGAIIDSFQPVSYGSE